MRVEADIFSGRPNPSWTVSTEGAEAFTESLRSLGALSEPPSEIPSLGYRGLVVTGLPGYGKIRAWRGHVILESGEGTKAYADPDNALEVWLLQSAEGRLEAGLVDILRRGIEG